MVDVLFIHPGGQKEIYQELSNNLTANCPPAYTLLLADYIRRQGRSAVVYDTNLGGWGQRSHSIITFLNFHQPKLIVIWVYGHHPSASTIG